MKTKCIGITGGIGSGKSVVCRLLRLMGVPVYISDLETRRVMAVDPEIRRRLIALLGEDVYAGGVLNKPLLAAYLFSDPSHAAQVNAIVHPQVKADFRHWVSQHSNAPWVAIESAILVEAGFLDVVDHIVMVTAPLEVRIARAMERDHSPREQIEQRVRSQMADEEKVRYAQSVLLNDGSVSLIEQVKRLPAICGLAGMRDDGR